MEISKPEDAVDTRLTALDRGIVLATEPPPTGEEIEPKGASGRSLVGAWAWSGRGRGVTSVGSGPVCSDLVCTNRWVLDP